MLDVPGNRLDPQDTLNEVVNDLAVEITVEDRRSRDCSGSLVRRGCRSTSRSRRSCGCESTSGGTGAAYRCLDEGRRASCGRGVAS